MEKREFYSKQALAGSFIMRGMLALLVVGAYLQAFSQSSSPYSRYGLGSVYSPVFSANRAMGDLAAPYVSGVHINYANPASYASLTRTTVELGMRLDGANIYSGDSNYAAFQPNISHLALAFAPNEQAKKRNWGVSLGLLPYTNINYTFIQDFNDTTLGAYRMVHAGKGSLYNVYAGGAYKIKGFSIGANFGFMFGKLDYQKTITFPDSVYALSSRNITSMNVRSFSYTIGVQYAYQIYHHSGAERRQDINMILGAYGSGGIKMGAKISNYWDRFYIDPTYGVLPVDTPSASFNKNATINLPFNIAAGAMFGNEMFWMIGADFKYMNWKSYTSPLNNGGLADSWRISVGAQIIPNSEETNRKKYLSLVQYRLGAYVGKSEIVYNSKQLTEAGGTVGLGFPFKRAGFMSGRLNLAGDFGRRSTSDATAISETFYRVTVGFVINDIWFIKRKFD